MKEGILVVGDAMLDFHVYGNTDRVSPEAPVPIVESYEENCTLGAASNVAAHITAAGIPCYFAFKSPQPPASVYNSHGTHDILCKEKKIKTIPLDFPEEHHITIKRRIWSNGQQVCRIDDESSQCPHDSVETKWLETIQCLIEEKNIKIVIFSDYNKGTLSDRLLMQLADHCRDLKIKTILDPKRPTFYKIQDMFIIKPNNAELFSTNLTKEQCSRRLKNTYLINTLGKEGMVILQNGKTIFNIPTLAQSVFDVTGCGDTASAILGISLYNDLTIQESVISANKAASFTIKHLGAYVLNKYEIGRSLKHGKEKACL